MENYNFDYIKYPTAFSNSLKREIKIEELKREEIRKNDYQCIYCKGIMSAIFPSDKTPHFRHYDPQQESICLKLRKNKTNFQKTLSSFEIKISENNIKCLNHYFSLLTPKSQIELMNFAQSLTITTLYNIKDILFTLIYHDKVKCIIKLDKLLYPYKSQKNKLIKEILQ